MELKPAELLKEFKTDKLRPVYYLFGEEAAAKAQAVEFLRERFKGDTFNLCEFSGDADQEAPAMVSECSTLPVFAERRLVIAKNPKLLAAAREVLAGYLKDPLASSTLILFSDDRKPDARDALAKAAAAAGAVCVFSPLREEEAVEKLKSAAKTAGKTLSEEAASALVAEAGTDWGVLSQELEKALLYAGKSKEVSEDDVLAVLGYRKSADPFALSRLIAERKLGESLAHLRRLFDGGKPEETAFKALGQISAAVVRQVKAKRLQKSGMPAESILGKLRLHPYWDRDYLKQLGRLHELRLRRDLKRCLMTEADLKSKTWLDPRLELERLVIDLSRE